MSYLANSKGHLGLAIVTRLNLKPRQRPPPTSCSFPLSSLSSMRLTHALPKRHVISSSRPSVPPNHPCPNSQHFSTTIHLSKKSQLPPRPTVPEAETYKTYLKGSGPGGQKINKTSSAVQLTHLPTGIVVKSQATRSRTQNESIARRILAEKVELLEKGSESRVEKKREAMSKKKRSALKKRRRKYRALNEAGEEASEGEVDEDVDEEEDTEEASKGDAENESKKKEP